MDALALSKLGAALILPWLAGALCLQRWYPPHNPGRLPLILGYGFFVGMMLGMGLLRLGYAFDLPPFAFASSGLVLLCLAAGFHPLPDPPPARGAEQAARLTPSAKPKGLQAGKLLSILLLLLILLHLLPMLLEVLVRPIYPWDGWTTWVYRAKIWFLNGELPPFVAASQLAEQTDRLVYTIEAWDYPLFVSLVHLWPALALDRWSETLVNLPTWLAGSTIALGLYGQSRSAGLEPLPALLPPALFLTIPLAGAHMLLGGYADLWMSGFVGLGFSALLLGKNRRELLMGLVFLAAAVLVKKEGIAWLTLGLFFLIATQWPRSFAGLMLVVTTVLALTHSTSVELPYVGAIGYRLGQLLLGPLGSYPLHFENVFPAYLHAFFLHGSWNLFWLILAVAAATALTRLRDAEVRDTLLLFVSSGLLLFLIFFLSPESRWASDFTAINRLPLQIAPALLTGCALIWNSLTKEAR